MASYRSARQGTAKRSSKRRTGIRKQATKGRSKRASRTRASVRPASRRSLRSIRSPSTMKRASRRRTLKTGKAGHMAHREPVREPLEFVEVPISGSAGSSYEPDSYTPKGDLKPQSQQPERQQNEPPRRRGFLGLFGRNG